MIKINKKKVVGFFVVSVILAGIIIFANSSEGVTGGKIVYKPAIKQTYIEDNYYLSVETNNSGKLIRIDSDQLLTIEEAVSYVSNIFDFATELSGGYCSEKVLTVPRNLKIEDEYYKFNVSTCRYEAVDSYNNFTSSVVAYKYGLDSLLKQNALSKTYIIDYNSETISFDTVARLPLGLKDLGIYLENTEYVSDMAYIRNLFLTYQDYSEVSNYLSYDFYTQYEDILTFIQTKLDGLKMVSGNG